MKFCRPKREEVRYCNRCRRTDWSLLWHRVDHHDLCSWECVAAEAEYWLNAGREWRTMISKSPTTGV